MMDGIRPTEREDGLPRGFVAAVLLLTCATVPLSALAAFFLESTSAPAMVHGFMDWSMLFLLLFTAALGFMCALVRPRFLIWIITASAAASMLSDGIHILVNMRLSGFEHIVPWTGMVGRFFPVAILTSGALNAVLFRPGSSRRGTGPLALMGTMGGAAILVFLFEWSNRTLLAVPQPHSLVVQPGELPNLALSLLNVLVLYPLIIRRDSSFLPKIVLLAGIPWTFAEFLTVFSPSTLYGRSFFAAHLSWLVADAIPLAGLSLYMVRSYWRENASLRSTEKLLHELEAAQNELRAKETLFNQLTQNIQEVFWISHPTSHEIYYVSPAYEAIFGLPAESLYKDNASFLQVVHPEDRQRMADLIADDIDREIDLDYRILPPHRAPGEIRWLRTRASPIRNEAGELYRLVGITEDVTDRKNAEERLRRSDARTGALLRAMPDLMFRISRAGIFLDYYVPPNVSLYRPPEVFLGANVTTVLGPGLGEKFLRSIEEVLSSGVVQSLEYRLPDGCEGEFEARIAPSTEDEVLVVVRNVTEHRQLEKEILEISNREQERIGHDLHDGISQQLTGIALLSKALQQQLASRSRPEAEPASRIAELLEDTILQTKSLARGLAPVELDAGGLPAALESLAANTERMHGVRCRVRCDRNVAIPSRTEATHLYRIAQEAVTNAIRHGKPARVGIELTASPGRLRLAISDDGTGVPSEPGPATGMGLHIMNYRARMIGGSLEIAAAPDHGTIVTCEWPSGDEAAHTPLKVTSALP